MKFTVIHSADGCKSSEIRAQCNICILWMQCSRECPDYKELIHHGTPQGFQFLEWCWAGSNSWSLQIVHHNIFIFVSFKQNYHCIIVSIFWIQFGTFFMARLSGGFPHMLIKGPQKSIGVFKWHWGLGRFSNVLENFRRWECSWKFSGGSGIFWEVLECSWEFWDASWRFSKVLLSCGKSWEVIVLGNSWRLLKFLKRCEMSQAVRGSWRLSEDLGDYWRFWEVVRGYGSF